MGKNLRKYLTLGGLVLGSLLPLKSGNAQTVPLNGPTSLDVIGNPFTQPNVTMQLGRKALEWYGSGDVNNDEKVDQSDLDEMNNGTSNKMSDIDGDGVPTTQNDKNILSDYLNGVIAYLPGHWNELTTKEERISWIEKMVSIDKTDTILSTDPSWICADRTIQEQMNFYGISNAQEFVQTHHTIGGKDYSLEDLAKFNIPVYLASTTSNTGPHSVLGVLVGSDPLNFEDWHFWSAYGDNTIFPGDVEMDENNPVEIGLEAYVQYTLPPEPVFNNVGRLFKWNLNNGVPTFVSTKPYTTLKNPNIIKVHVGSLENLLVDNYGLPLNQNYTPNFLKSRGYNAVPDTTKENTELPIDLEYIDRDTVNLGENHFKFNRKFVASIYSGGVTKLDSTSHEIEVDNLTPVETEIDNTPKDFKLDGNYPNPFNPITTIKYELPEDSKVNIKIFNAIGKEILTLVDEEKAAGRYEVSWQAGNLPSGIYFYKIITGTFSAVGKMTLLK